MQISHIRICLSFGLITVTPEFYYAYLYCDIIHTFALHYDVEHDLVFAFAYIPQWCGVLVPGFVLQVQRFSHRLCSAPSSECLTHLEQAAWF